MRKIIILLALIGFIVLFFTSCEVSKTYTSGEVEGICAEVTTSDQNIISDLEDADFEEGTCPSDDVVHDCTVSMPVVEGGEDVDVTFYFYSPTYDQATAELMCAIIESGK